MVSRKIILWTGLHRRNGDVDRENGLTLQAVSCIAGRFFTDWATREEQINFGISTCEFLGLLSLKLGLINTALEYSLTLRKSSMTIIYLYNHVFTLFLKQTFSNVYFRFHISYRFETLTIKFNFSWCLSSNPFLCIHLPNSNQCHELGCTLCFYEKWKGLNKIYWIYFILVAASVSTR